LDSLQGQTSFLFSKASRVALEPSSINEYRRLNLFRRGLRRQKLKAVGVRYA